MDTLVEVLIFPLQLMPLALVFFVPALLGVATFKERNDAYRVKAALWFLVGFGVIAGLHAAARGGLNPSLAAALVAQMLLALLFARLIVYGLAD